MTVYYPGDEITFAEQAVIDELMAFPKDSPLAFYDACMRHVPFKSHLNIYKQNERLPFMVSLSFCWQYKALYDRIYAAVSKHHRI